MYHLFSQSSFPAAVTSQNCTDLSMRVLAIDPGYDRLGVAVLDRNPNNGTLIHSSCITSEKSAPLPERIERVGAQLLAIMEEYAPTAVALERLYFTSNQKTAMGVAEMRGVVVYLAQSRACRIFEYTPQEIKVAVTGYGKSDKKQVAAMVARLVPNVPKGVLDDEYDAIAIAITALARER